MNDQELYKKFEEYFSDRGWTFELAAEAINVSRSTLFNWKTGKPISKRGRMAMRALVADSAPPASPRPSECSFDVPPPVFVPLLTVAQAATLQGAPFGPSGAGIEEGEQSGFVSAKPGDFAIVVSGRSMMPWYPPGTHVLVRPGKVPQTGNRVVAMMAEDIEPIFKIYIDLGGRFALLSINEQEGIPPCILDKMDRTEWYWCWPIVESKRNEDDLDASMKEFGVRHHWQEWLEEEKHCR